MNKILTAVCCLLAVLAMACTCHYEFHPLRPDHHGFQIAFATGCLIFLLRGGLGWVRRADGGGPSPIFGCG